MTLLALAGSASQVGLRWDGGRAGEAWQLERRRSDQASFEPLAVVDAAGGVHLDGAGLAPATRYTYRLLRSNGSVAAEVQAETSTEAPLKAAAGTLQGAPRETPVGPAAAVLGSDDGRLQLRLPAGALAAAGTASTQAQANPLPDGVGHGVRWRLPARPTRPVDLVVAYTADDDPDEVLQQRVAMRQADGAWWLLPVAAHDAAARRLTVRIDPAFWQAVPDPAAPLRSRRALAASDSPGPVTLELLRVVAVKLKPARASVRVLGRQRLVPVAIYQYREVEQCANPADPDCLPVPVPGLVEREWPVLNRKPGYQRLWRLEGSTSPAGEHGQLDTQGEVGAVYTAPPQLPVPNPVTVRFESVHGASGRRLALSARIRVTEDSWVGTLTHQLARDGIGGYHYTAATRWVLSAGESSDQRRVYRAQGDIALRIDSACGIAADPATHPIVPGGTYSRLVVDELDSPPSYTLQLDPVWNGRMLLSCSQTSAPTQFAAPWDVRGVVQAGQIQGSAERPLVRQTWQLRRPE